MNRIAPEELFPRVLGHIYWERKKQFLLDEDLYADWVVFAVEEGEFRYGIGDAEGTATRGDLVVCPPRVPFRRKTAAPLTFHYLVVDWGAAEEAVRQVVPAGRISIGDTGRFLSTCAYLRRLAEQNPAAPPSPWVSRLFQDLWLQVGIEQEAGLQPIDSLSSGSDPLMEQAAEEIRRRAFEELSLKQLSDAYGLSPVQFTRRFRQCCGRTPSEFLRTIRLRRASRLLEETSLTLEEIAGRCGYETGFYLSRVFTKAYGTSPSEYRKARRL